jgi:two-component system, NtrC family, sensor kinase
MLTVRIRTKLVLLLTAALVATMGLATWLRVTLTRRQLEAEADQRAREVADDIRRALEALPASAGRMAYADILQGSLDQHRTLVSVELLLQEGTALPSRIVAAPGKKPLITHGASLGGLRAFEPLAVTRTHKVAGQRLIQTRVEVDPEGPLIGQLTTRTSLESVDKMVATQEIVSLYVTLGSILLAAVIISVILEQLVVRRLGQLGGAMGAVEAGDLKSRMAEPRGRDELAQLARGFNRMIARLDEADAEIRAFNQRLAAEVDAATHDLQVKNATLAQLNRLLVETRRELGDKERLAALGQLAAQLAHEIGTPLGSISGHLQLALGNRECPTPLRERLGVTIREVERVGKIVRDYLDSTRPAKPTLSETRMDRIVDEAIELARSAKPSSDVTFERRIADGAATIETDPGLLRQIVVNLLTNALDASSAGGKIVVQVDADGDVAHLRVRDAGAGIDPQDLARIFEPFYTTKGRGKGTGLGLAICKELAQALGGRISVESEPGKGSIFTVTLPRRSQPVRGRSAA